MRVTRVTRTFGRTSETFWVRGRHGSGDDLLAFKLGPPWCRVRGGLRAPRRFVTRTLPARKECGDGRPRAQMAKAKRPKAKPGRLRDPHRRPRRCRRARREAVTLRKQGSQPARRSTKRRVTVQGLPESPASELLVRTTHRGAKYLCAGVHRDAGRTDTLFGTVKIHREIRLVFEVMLALATAMRFEPTGDDWAKAVCRFDAGRKMRVTLRERYC